MLFQNKLRLTALILLLGSCVVGFLLDSPGQFLAGLTYGFIVGATVLFELIVLVILSIYYRYASSGQPGDSPSNNILDTPIHSSFNKPISRTVYCIQTAFGVLVIGSILFFAGIYLLEDVL